MGRALLVGLLDATEQGNARPPFHVNYVACTRTERSAQSLREELGTRSARVQVESGKNLEVMKSAHIIVLGIKPYMASEVLRAPGVREALAGKLVVTLLAGIDVATIKHLINQEGPQIEPEVYVAKAMPNIAARYRESITVLEESTPPLHSKYSTKLEWIFDQVGKTKYLPSHLLDLATVLTTASMSTTSLALDGLLDGSVVEGLRRQDALDMAAQGLKGLATLLENGAHPAVLRENMSSPRGCTIQTLVALEKASARGMYAQALIDGVRHLHNLQKDQ